MSVYEVIKESLIQNWLLVIIMSLSWIIIVGGFRFYKLFFPYVILRLPIYAAAKYVDFIAKSPWEKNPLKCEIKELNPNIVDDMANKLTNILKIIDNFSFFIANPMKSFSKLFFSYNVTINLTRKIYQDDVLSIEKNLSMIQTFSKNLNTAETGLLNSIGNPIISQNEKKSFLLYTLKCGQNNLKMYALYHMFAYINNQSEMNEVKGIVSQWDINERNDANKMIKSKELMLLENI